MEIIYIVIVSGNHFRMKTFPSVCAADDVDGVTRHGLQPKR